MSATSKFDMPSGSPDRPTFPSGQRGVYTAASLDRLGSFREGMENRMQSTRPTMPRSGSTLSQADVANFVHSLPLDTKLMAAGQKFPRQAGLNRAVTAAFGISPDDPLAVSTTSRLLPASLEGIKRVKDCVHDSAIRASEQVKILGEAISKFDKHFSSVWSRKRPRSDVQPSDRLNAPLAGDRFVIGGTTAKLATQGHFTTSGYDYEPQKSEEQTKIAVSNKRNRTSALDVQMDIRDSALGRPSTAMDRDREMPGIANGGLVQSEEKEQRLSTVMDGWEKSKMRKKRSGIKSDVTTSTLSTRTADGERESKRDVQQRLGIDARSRLSSANSFRSGPSIGVVGVGKSDLASQQVGLGMRSTPRAELDNTSLLSDRRDRLTPTDKEKLNLKSNKLNIRESSRSASPTSAPKMNASTRAPRSSSGAVPKLSPNVHRSLGVPDDWELTQSTNKLHSALGSNNRKRTLPTRSSSPPVAQWASQRPQKISRVARRTNFVPLLSSTDEGLVSEAVPNVAGTDTGTASLRRSSGNGLQQVKLKSDQYSSATLSESEESGAAEIKSKDKSKKSGEIDEKARPNGQKVSPPASSRRSKIRDEDHGDGVRRQGRTMRGINSARSGVTMAVEKLDKAVTAKQLRSARLGVDKFESKPGRPPTRKLSDRKAYTRPRHSLTAGAHVFHGEPHITQEEILLAAANAAISSGHACSSSLWTRMEPLFGFISTKEVAYLKQQRDSGSNFLSPTAGAVCDNGCVDVPNRFDSIEWKRSSGFSGGVARPVERFTEELVSRSMDSTIIPLCQRLIAALVPEEDSEGFLYGGDEDLKFDVYGTRFELDVEARPTNMNQYSPGSFLSAGKSASNGYKIPGTGRYHNGMGHHELDLVAVPNAGGIGTQPNQELVPTMSCTEFQYSQMSMDERLLLEIQSIGIFPEPVPDLAQKEDDEIGEDIRKLEEKLQQQAMKKERLHGELEKPVIEARELQEREIERRAFDKLIMMTYDKYMSCWGPNASCGKGASGKIAKQAALGLVKQTLVRCQKFEELGESCFNEPVFLDVFRSVASHSGVVDCEDDIARGEPTNLYCATPARSPEVKVSGTNMHTHDKYYSDGFQSVNHMLKEATGKVDIGSNKLKKRELLLDDVAGTSRVPSGIGSSLPSGTKGKRSERDREGKGHNRDMLPRNGTAKIGRPALGTVKGERKTKSKLKHKTTQLSASVNDLLGNAKELPKAEPSALRSCGTNMDTKTKKKDELLDTFNESEALDLSHLQLPGLDVLGVPDDLDGQGQDIGSWLDIEEDGLLDDDFMGLEIPMDDLTGLNMMV